ncbi:hypothetical protein GCM10010174_35840 [Kutzneria viridogrisea]|uniref:Amino acid adenylation domain-containing protein n=1 Tax=Kutzneria viridogrisea TaxID=47990 RepID=A0ABR6BM67_9PSEU|nr:amino acid adenylation domain-containing protein [Kutzneria viridogrisea]
MAPSVDDAPTPLTQLSGLVGEVLGRGADAVLARATEESFVALGGTSMDAIKLVGLAERRLALAVDAGGLLGRTPLAAVLAAASECPPVAQVEPGEGPELLELMETQRGLLLSENFSTGTEWHMLSSAELTGPLDLAALRETLRWLAARHESLRTVLVREDGQVWRRVVPEWEPELFVQSLRVPEGDSPVRAVHEQLGSTSNHYLSPWTKPSYAFVLTTFGEQHHLLSMLVHHVISDGWSVGLMWQEFAQAYGRLRAGQELDPTPAPTPDVVVRRRQALDASGSLVSITQDRIAQLSGLPTVVEVPSDTPRPQAFDYKGAMLDFGLSRQAREACEQLAARAKVTRTAVLLGAWALVIGRRTGMAEFLIANSVGMRPTEEILGVFGPCAAPAPMVCRLPEDQTVEQFLHGTAAAMADSLSYGDVRLAELMMGTGAFAVADGRRIPMTQIVFSANDQFAPESLHAGELEVRLHEGHCGGAPNDLLLYVQRWGDSPLLSLEYATSAYSASDANDLAEAVEGTLLELERHYADPLGTVRGMSDRQRQVLLDLRDGRPADVSRTAWQLVERQALATPDAVAVQDPQSDITLTYRQLHTAVEIQSAMLAAAEVRENDHVVVAVPRSAAEVVAVLAILRLGVAYVSLHPASPPDKLTKMLAKVHPKAIIGTESGVAPLLPLMSGRCAVVAPADLSAAGTELPIPPAAPADPERVAYILFTSGSTGDPKPVRVPDRAIVRLVADPDYIDLRPEDRYMRFATLSFDVSVLEVFTPLISGGALVVCPETSLTPSELAQFFAQQHISVVYLTSGLFRVLADSRPDAFAGVRCVLAGGDVVPAEQVRSLLQSYPGLRVGNLYGPTENGVWTTLHLMSDASEVSDPLPIGRPMAGNGVLVLDEAGRLVPPGGVGELCCLGDGLAVDYYNSPEQNAKAFGITEDGLRIYRTGDVARWDRLGRVRFFGRRDNQVKIMGFRVELGEVRSRLLEHPSVRDALVIAVGADSDSRRVLAGVVLAEDAPCTREELAGFVAETVPAYAVPTLWAIVDRMPVTPNGKADVRALEQAAHATTDVVPAQ